MRAPHHRRTEEIGACLADPFANGEGRSLRDREALARRMIAYRLMIRERFPDALLRQVVVYTGREPLDCSRLGISLDYTDRDDAGCGIAFGAPLRDFRATPAAEFLRSGRLDDLILGLMAAGGDDDAYVAEVLRHVRAAEGEARRLAREKYLAVCATMTSREALRGVEDLAMWLEDVKDSPFIQQIAGGAACCFLPSAPDEVSRPCSSPEPTRRSSTSCSTTPTA